MSGLKYGTSEKSDYSYTGIPVLRIPNIGDNGVLLSDIKYLNHFDVDDRDLIHRGDILIIRSNGSRDLVGKCVMVPELDRAYAYASFLIKIIPSAIVNAEFLSLFLNSSMARRQMFVKAKSSAGIHNINSKELGDVVLSLPPLWEQIEIVNRVKESIQKEQEAQMVAEKTLDHIDSMKRAVLVKAFRGELGTNDPSEPPVELS